MKTLLLSIILLFTLNVKAQTTYVPDNNFEAYLEANGMGNGIPNDDYVTTSNINSIAYLYMISQSISDLTGIEDFSSLIELQCTSNLLTTLNLTQNTALTSLLCDNNNLTTLDLTQNPNLTSINCYTNQLETLLIDPSSLLSHINCSENQLTSLDVSQFPNLTSLFCADNQLTSLDVSQNTLLQTLYCLTNQLTCLNVKNGNNTNLADFNATDNPNLICIEVDDAAWSTSNWTLIDSQTSFSTDCSNACSSVGLNELNNSPNQLLRITDLMGRETPYKPNMVLIYVYDDGSTERVFKMEDE